MRMAQLLAIAIAGGFIAGSVAVFGLRAAAVNPSAIKPVWAEVKWPFPVDQWGTGKAFACTPADCGAKLVVYVRPKIGFCNCSTGVSDDAELERVSDTDLVSRDVQPLGSGHRVKVGWMEGLIRAYQASGQAGGRLLSVAFNDECDVVVAVAAVDQVDSAVAEPAVMAFLDSRPMVLWAKKELGLEFVRRDW